MAQDKTTKQANGRFTVAVPSNWTTLTAEQRRDAARKMARDAQAQLGIKPKG